MFLNLRKYALAFAAICGVAATAQAVPVTYSFSTSGTHGTGTGSVAGLFGATETASGTFTYENVSPTTGAVPLPGGTGLAYFNGTELDAFMATEPT